MKLHLILGKNENKLYTVLENLDTLIKNYLL